MDAAHIQGKRFSVIGGARSGIAVAKLLRANGATVFLSDVAPLDKMLSVRKELENADIATEFGVNSSRVLEAEVLVLSPGVPSGIPIVKEALARGLKVVSEIEAASWFCPAPMIAVTGTNGKTTTTTLLGRMFHDARRQYAVAGNIGTAFSQVVGELGAEATAILEISSFQLDHIETFKPKVSVILNITPDHLDRYEHSFEKYAASKCRVFENQRSGDVVVYNDDDEVTRSLVEKHIHPQVMKLPFSVQHRVEQGGYLDDDHVRVRVGGADVEIIGKDDISIRGVHNLYNAMAATLAARALNISTASLRSTLRNFKGVEHRLEFVREVNGVTYVNDSKATNVDSVWYALQSFDKPLVVLLGGRDKGNDYSRLTDLVKKNARAIVAIGESAEKVESAFRDIVPLKKAGSMNDAVQMAGALATKGDIVLLSPACASFDWFDNYEHRGRVFKEIVMAL
ncbi:MAG: UDP-N-acetylmuramoyl-L-alanine--D-glutamate ligase [Bacteroidota bacterium]